MSGNLEGYTEDTMKFQGLAFVFDTGINVRAHSAIAFVLAAHFEHSHFEKIKGYFEA